MYSGGKSKIPPYVCIYIEASNKNEAISVFYSKFKRNPCNVTCTCCGPDYAISSDESFRELTAYTRNCARVFFYTDSRVREEAVESTLGVGITYDRETQEPLYKGRPVFVEYVERACLDGMNYGKSLEECTARYVSTEQYAASEDVCIVPSSDIGYQDRDMLVPSSGWTWVE